MHWSIGKAHYRHASAPSPDQRTAAIKVYDAPVASATKDKGERTLNARAAGDTQPSRPSVRLTKKQSTNLVNFTHRLTAALHFLAKSVRAHSASESNAALATNCEALARGLRALPANAVDFGLLFQGITAAEAALKALGGDRGFVQKTKWRLFHRQVVRADVASLASSSLRQLHADATILRSFLKKSGVPADRFDTSDLNPAQRP